MARISTRARFDVVVVGLGAMGSASAAQLARRGARVLALDRLDPPHMYGSTHGRTRIIREAYFEHELYIPLVRRAFALWRTLEEEEGASLLTISGALVAGLREGDFVSGTLRSLRHHRVRHETLDADEIRHRFPMFRPTVDLGGIYEPGAGVLAVDACLRAQIASARRAGAETRTGVALRSWTAAPGGVSVETNDGTWIADSLVLAAGPWLPEMIGSLPLSVERQVQVWFSPLQPAECQVGVLPAFVLRTSAGSTLYGIPDAGDGVKAAFHHGGEIGPLDALSRTISAADVDPVADALRSYLPAAAGGVREASVCYYTNTPDGDFLVDRLPDQERVWVVSACSGHGFKFAPVIGELVASSVTAGRRDPALAPFGIDRFARGGDLHISR